MKIWTCGSGAFLCAQSLQLPCMIANLALGSRRVTRFFVQSVPAQDSDASYQSYWASQLSKSLCPLLPMAWYLELRSEYQI